MRKMMKMEKEARILLITTGGTIATTETKEGPTLKYLGDTFLSEVPDIKDYCRITSKSLINIDSVNMQYQHWVEIARTIADNYQNYEGFVITHGTDTMAYTACALSYMLKNLNKPVVLTGGQKSIEQKSSDSHRNFIDAVKFASEGLEGVYIVFGRRVIAGTRATKLKTKSYDGFVSINYPYIAKLMGDKIIYSRNCFSPDMARDAGEELILNTSFCPEILLIKLIPNFKLEFFDAVAELYEGFVIEGFGNGGVPFKNKENIFTRVNELAASHKPVVLTTQCLEEGTNLGRYPLQEKISNSDIIDGRDMTTEAILTKLMWILGQTKDIKEIKEMFYRPVMDDVQKDWVFG